MADEIMTMFGVVDKMYDAAHYENSSPLDDRQPSTMTVGMIIESIEEQIQGIYEREGQRDDRGNIVNIFEIQDERLTPLISLSHHAAIATRTVEEARSGRWWK